MEAQHKQAIKKNYSLLAGNTNLDTLLQKLEGIGLLSDKCIATIKSKPAHEQNAVFYQEITKRGSSAFEALIHALAESGQSQIATVLDPKFDAESYLKGLATGTPEFIFSADGTEKVRAGMLPMSIRTSDDHYTKFLPKHCEAYTMESNPRGYALIINIIFRGTPSFREGADIDGENMKNLWLGMGYEVEYYEDLKKQSAEDKMEKFSKKNFSKVDSCVVVMMSHGLLEGIQTADGCLLEYIWIMDKFNNRNCPSLQEKPRIFFFQACRGNTQDTGVPVAGLQMHADRLPEPMGPVTITNTYLDTFYYNATIPGYAAFRCCLGSLFLLSICDVFMDFAYELDLASMMEKVTVKVNKLCQLGDYRQTVNADLRGVQKKLYFNPPKLPGTLV